ncbi:hypothetical protein MBGDF03_01092 [Thermoplasmatales archaeon SCGC AB-540-F20]|nr:hypothetical protein MBGDF03_01092 [Thermoplasmatales archaeon SCGC AB-540-F20]
MKFLHEFIKIFSFDNDEDYSDIDLEDTEFWY